MGNNVKFEISNATIIKIILWILLVWFLFCIREVVVLFFIVMVVVAAIGPLVDKMAKYIPRALALIFLTVVFIGLLVGIGFLIVPPVVHQVSQLAINLPYLISKISPFYESIRDSVTNYQEGLFNISSQLARLTSGIYSTTIGFISGLVGILTILVLSFYMLLEQESLKSFLHQTVPAEHKDKIFQIAKKIGSKMGSWLRGQMLLMLIIGVLDGIALLIIGLISQNPIPYVLTLAVWGGLTEVIPYVGPWLGILPAFVIALTISPWHALGVLIAYLIIQQMEAQFLAPKIMGKAVGLSPVIIILSLIAGAKMMGILGVVIAVPIAAAISVIIQDWPEIKKIKEKT